MKRMLLFVLGLLCCFFPAWSMADDAGVLSEGELSQWIDQTLRLSRDVQPLNAPVGEDAFTEDGYAFLYDFATLYYHQPQLDENSILQGVTLADSSYAAPRGIALGSSQDALLQTFGWQNPMLMGDGSFAAFYYLSDLPRAAYWSWAQHDGEGQISRVQCAVHVMAAENQYTDAGIIFELENGVVTDIRVYGLHDFVTLADVQSNLSAVMNVEAAGAGHTQSVQGYTTRHETDVFNQQDLSFGGICFPHSDVSAIEKALGETVHQTGKVTSGDEVILTAEWPDVYATIAQNGEMDLFSVFSDRLCGPRGIRVGQQLEEVIALFYADGQGTTDGKRALLYGDGENTPNGMLDVSGSDATLSYTLTDSQNVTLMMQFMDGIMQEWMLYTW